MENNEEEYDLISHGKKYTWDQFMAENNHRAKTKWFGLWQYWNKLRWLLKDIPYFIRTHTYNRYHIINLKTPDVYHWGWIEPDTRIMIACFKCLEYFVEEQDGLDGLIYEVEDDAEDFIKEGAKEHYAAGQEILFLYNWWKNDYPELQETDHTGGRTIYDIEDEMLHRVIKIRKHLWT